jgi:thioredoxin-related protein
MKISTFKINIYHCFFLAASALILSGNVSSQYLNFDAALSKAKTENKRIIVDVYTDWCGWCKKMDEEVYGSKKIRKIIEKNFILVKLDAESQIEVSYSGERFTEQDLALFFEVSGYPTTVFLEPDGKIIEFRYNKEIMKNLPGYFKSVDFYKMLKFIRDAKYKDTDLSTIL